MEILAVLVIAAVAGVVGIGLGILVAPAVARLAERVDGGSDDEREDGDER